MIKHSQYYVIYSIISETEVDIMVCPKKDYTSSIIGGGYKILAIFSNYEDALALSDYLNTCEDEELPAILINHVNVINNCLSAYEEASYYEDECAEAYFEGAEKAFTELKELTKATPICLEDIVDTSYFC